MSGAEILLQPGVFPRLLQGLWVTVWIAGVSVGASIPVGLLVGWLMTLKNPVIRAAMRIYLDFIRIMPQLALLFLAYYGFARWFDWNLDATGACVLVFILWGGAELGDLVRGALQSIPKVQYESSYVLGRGHQGRPADYRREPIPVPDWNLVDLWRDFLYVLHRVLAAVHCGPPTGKEVVE